MTEIKTRIWKTLDTTDFSAQKIFSEVAESLLKSEIIAFPTETVYGLGANAFDDEAVDKIYLAKGRPATKPLAVLIADREQLSSLVEEIDAKSAKLMESFWPGPLTIVMKHKPGLSPLITAGLSTIGVRMPAHKVALAIIKATGVPLATPSANTSGGPSPTTAEQVYADLKGKIDGIVDGGSTGSGLESTVIDMTGDIPTILRPGGVSLEALQRVIGEVRSRC
jgi:L-threonylcarbamoyladenylate synthase